MSEASGLRFVIDVNLSPEWVDALARLDCESVHWSTVGDVRTPDADIMSWAREHSFIVLTGDLDFGTLLAMTHLSWPSVLSLRTRKRLPEDILSIVQTAIAQHRIALLSGALVVTDEVKSRVRILPL